MLNTIRTILILLCILFIGSSCTEKSVRQEYEQLTSEIRNLQSKNRNLVKSLSSEYGDLSFVEIERRLERNLHQYKTLLESLKSEASIMKTSITQIRSVSVVYDDLGTALNKFNAQSNDILAQQNLFERKNSDFGYIGTRHARRIALQELRVINTNLIRQCRLQKNWFQELASHSQTQIRSVNWSKDSYRQLAETKYEKMIEPMRVKMPVIEQYLNYNETFDFGKLEQLVNGR